MKEATSFRVRKNSLYDKKSDSPFKISSLSLVIFELQRCFYLDRV